MSSEAVAAVVVAQPAAVAPASLTWGREQVELIKRTVAQGATADELQLFLYQAKRMGLDPLAKQVHAIKRWNGEQNREVMAIQVGIDGFRLVAERTGKYSGQDGPYWCGDDGVWHDVWLSDKAPAAAKVGVYRVGFEKPLYRIALFREYVQKKRDGSPVRMWQTMPAGQLAKCAESLALRAAFPAELSGVYTADEMQQADNHEGEPHADTPKTEPKADARPAQSTDKGQCPKCGKWVRPSNYPKPGASHYCGGCKLGFVPKAAEPGDEPWDPDADEPGANG